VRQQIFHASLFTFHFFLLPLHTNNQNNNKNGRLPGESKQIVRRGTSGKAANPFAAKLIKKGLAQ